MEEKKKEKRNWPIYSFLTLIVGLLFLILCSIYYFTSLFYSWVNYSLEQDGYYMQDESYDNTTGNEITIYPEPTGSMIIDSNNTVNNTVE